MPTPQISKITLPSGQTYFIKDAEARSQIQALVGGDAVVFMGVSTTEITDGGSEVPTIGGEAVTPATGQLFFYGTEQFVWGPDGTWHELGSLDSLGALAYKDSATGNYTPSGTVSQPTFTGTSSTVTITAENNNSGNYQPAGIISGGIFTGSNTTFTGKFTPSGNITTTTATTENKTATVSKAASGTATYTPQGSVEAPAISVKTAGSTTTVKNPTSVTVAKTVIAAAPGTTAPDNSLTYYSVSNETLSLYQLGYTTGDSITTNNVTVKTGDAAYEATAPTFTGTGLTIQPYRKLILVLLMVQRGMLVQAVRQMVAIVVYHLLELKFKFLVRQLQMVQFLNQLLLEHKILLLCRDKGGITWLIFPKSYSRMEMNTIEKIQLAVTLVGCLYLNMEKVRGMIFLLHIMLKKQFIVEPRLMQILQQDHRQGSHSWHMLIMPLIRLMLNFSIIAL